MEKFDFMDAYYENTDTYTDKVQTVQAMALDQALTDNYTGIEYNANLVTKDSPVREKIEISNPSTEAFDRRRR